MSKTKSTVISNTDTATATEVVAECSDFYKESIQKTKTISELKDSDEIEVISLIPNVSYKDSHTGDIYKWDKAGHAEDMTFDTLKNMWRNDKGYFKNLWLKPNDNRVINKFKLNNIFEKYELLMNESSYTKDNIDNIVIALDSVPNELYFTICNKIKGMITSEKITDITIIKALDKKLKTDLISYI